MRDRWRSTAFTLIELLVVVAIIAVLIAILLPALKSARESARTVVCGSNERSVGIAVLQYTETFNDTLPNCDDNGYLYNWSYKLIHAGLVPSAIGTTHNTWWIYPSTPQFFIFEGVQSATPGQARTIFHCPSATEADLGVSWYTNAYGTPHGVMGSFTPEEPRNPKFSRMTMFERLDNTVAAYDGMSFTLGDNVHDVGPIWGAVWIEATKSTMDVFLSRRHSGGANCLFLDGHARLVRLMEINATMFPHRWMLPR